MKCRRSAAVLPLVSTTCDGSVEVSAAIRCSGIGVQDPAQPHRDRTDKSSSLASAIARRKSSQVTALPS